MLWYVLIRTTHKYHGFLEFEVELKRFMRGSDKRQRAQVAEACGTTVPYLYQIAGRHRRASPPLAIRIEAATREVGKGTDGQLQAVPRASLVRNPEIFDPQAPLRVEIKH